jgi:hypothetical protein
MDNIQTHNHSKTGKLLFLFLLGVAILIGVILVVSPVTIAGNT